MLLEINAIKGYTKENLNRWEAGEVITIKKKGTKYLVRIISSQWIGLHTYETSNINKLINKYKITTEEMESGFADRSKWSYYEDGE